MSKGRDVKADRHCNHSDSLRLGAYSEALRTIDFEEQSHIVSDLIGNTSIVQPSPALRPFITQYAGYRASGLPSGVHFGLPSSDVHLIISLGNPIEVIKMPDLTQWPLASTALVSGLQHGPAMVRQKDTAFGLHVFIKPLGVRAILGVASAEIAALVLNLSDIWGSRAEGLVEMLRSANSWHQCFAILDRAFASRIHSTNAQPEISWAWERLAKSHGTVRVQKLTDEIGYSRRHFSERFRDVIGVTPKFAGRVFRFERACRLIADHRLNLAHVAIRCGYYDQAHLTREWFAFAGCSPRTWVARDLPFLQDYELGGSDNEWYDCESDKR